MIGGKNKRIQELEEQVENALYTNSVLTQKGFEARSEIDELERKNKRLENEKRGQVASGETGELKNQLDTALSENTALKRKNKEEINLLLERCNQLQTELRERTREVDNAKSVTARFAKKLEKLQAVER